jgi:hypothetical protein
MLTPKKLQNQIDKLYNDVYLKEFENTAKNYFDEKIKPYCVKNKLSFSVMNGIPRMVNQENQYVRIPKIIENILDISDPEGIRIIWYLPNYKYSEKADFNEADTNYWTNRAKARLKTCGGDELKASLSLAFSI